MTTRFQPKGSLHFSYVTLSIALSIEFINLSAGSDSRFRVLKKSSKLRKPLGLTEPIFCSVNCMFNSVKRGLNSPRGTTSIDMERSKFFSSWNWSFGSPNWSWVLSTKVVDSSNWLLDRKTPTEVVGSLKREFVPRHFGELFFKAQTLISECTIMSAVYPKEPPVTPKFAKSSFPQNDQSDFNKVRDDLVKTALV